jgi:hypothetical protein
VKSYGKCEIANMGVLSILNRLKFDAKLWVPLIFVGFIIRSVNSTSPVASENGDVDINVEKLSYCDEQLLNDRGNSKR